MSGETGIEWTDATWNPTRGCSRVSEGCRNCYAEKIAARFSDTGQPFDGFAATSPPRWTGHVALIPEKLGDPLRWKKPRRVFVNSMSDLFHERLPDDAIDRVFAVMACAPQHRFQVLTKRPERMRDYLFGLGVSSRRIEAACPVGYALRWEGISLCPWPLPNVWLGVSVEDQATADARIPILLATPAAVRFISAEPLLGPIEHLRPYMGFASALDWVIVGGESGPGARALDIAWVRSIVEQCYGGDVACFVKQLGKYPSSRQPEPGWQQLRETRGGKPSGDWAPPSGPFGKHGDPKEWPEDLRVREFPVETP